MRFKKWLEEFESDEEMDLDDALSLYGYSREAPPTNEPQILSDYTQLARETKGGEAGRFAELQKARDLLIQFIKGGV